MDFVADIFLAALICLDLALAGVSRLPGAIRLIAAQGVLVGLLPFVLHGEHLTISLVNTFVKGGVMPLMLVYAMKKANTVRELEPIVGFGKSVAIVFALILASVGFCGPLGGLSAGRALTLPTAISFATIATGLFLIVSRRKAITQVIGFLCFENGISIFAAAIAMDYGLVIELGILLDVFALVFILGIAIYEVSRTFSSIDTDRLNRLGDAKYLHPHGKGRV